MKEFQFIRVDVDHSTAVATITLNRPDKRNALSLGLLDEFHQALLEIRQDEGIGAILSRGDGRAYSAGRDLYEMREVNRTRSPHWYERGQLADIIQVMQTAPQVTIAAVRGFCLGGGLALMLGHDLVVAAHEAQIGMPEVLRGSFGNTATASLFHSGLPFKKAFWISLTSRNLSGREASEAGLVSLSLPDDKVDGYADELAREVASHSHRAIEHAKIAAYLHRDVEYFKSFAIDNLVSSRQNSLTDPLSDVEGYLRSQKGGTKTTYVRPDQPRGAGASGD
jgi:enoyl-CoA hydratase/carnithine racemase